MTESDFLDFARAAVRRIAVRPDRIGNLVLTQTRKGDEPTLREPEMRTALQQEADHRGLLYGIEVPTRHTYQFTGIGKRRALTDFALLDPETPNEVRDVLVELKEGQPSGKDAEVEGEVVADSPAISKDLHKLRAERVRYGRCMLHICQAANAGTLPALVKKYDAAMRRALVSASATVGDTAAAHSQKEASEPWFILLILVLRQRGKANAAQGPRLYIGKWDGVGWTLQGSDL